MRADSKARAGWLPESPRNADSEPAMARRVAVAGYAYSAPRRAVAGTLTALAGAALLLILILVVSSTDPPVTPGALFRLVGLIVLPLALSAWWIRRASRARVEVDHLSLAITCSGLRLEVPLNAIDAVLPWSLPLPGAGFWLRMRSGRRLRYGIESHDTARLLTALAEVGEVGAAAGAAQHPTVIYAAARSALGQATWLRRFFKFGVFAALPAGVLFNAHQHIAYGGPLGEYYMLGLRSYLTTLAIYYATAVVYLILYAAAWRIAAEVVALLAARLAPPMAVEARKAVETTCAVAYFAGVPALLLLRFLP